MGKKQMIGNYNSKKEEIQLTKKYIEKVLHFKNQKTTLLKQIRLFFVYLPDNFGKDNTINKDWEDEIYV